MGGFIAIQTPAVQTYITGKALDALNKDFGTKIEAEKVDLNFWGDVKLYNVTAKDHKDLQFIQIEELIADISYLALIQDQNNISLDDIELKNAKIEVITYQGEEDSNFIKFIDSFDDGEESSEESTFKLVGNVVIADSQLSIINENLPKEEQIWLDAKNFNAELKNVDITSSVYGGDIHNLRFTALKNGEDYEVKEFSSDFKMNSEGIFFNDLNIETQSSVVDGHIHLKYDSLAQFSQNFGDLIQWDLNLKDKSKVGFKDVRYFVLDWDKSEVVSISGKAKGSLNDLNLENFKAETASTKIETKQFNLGDLMNGGYTLRTDYVDITTSYNGLNKFLPHEIVKEIPKDIINRLGEVNYKGSLQLNDKDLQGIGKAKTALGNADFDLKMYDYTADSPRYVGSVKTDSFDLKKLTGTDELGTVRGNLAFNGKGFDIETLKIDAKGTLNYFEYDGTRYNNISLDGVLSQQKYDGILAINDTSTKLNYNGVFDFSQEELKLDFDSEIQYVDLTALGLTTRKNTWLRAKVAGEGQFSSLKDLVGKVKLIDIRFHSDTIQLDLPETFLEISKINNGKQLNLEVPGYILADIDGQFEIDELPDVFMNGIGNFLVHRERKKVSSGQKFNFNLSIQDDIVGYFVPDLYLQPETIIIGQADENKKVFHFELNSPYVQYQDIKADNVYLDASTNDHTFSFLIDKMDVKGYEVRDFKFRGVTKQDSIVANAHFFSGVDITSEFDLNFYQTLNNKNELKTGFAPSYMNIDGSIWEMNPKNSRDSNYAILDFNNTDFLVKDILFQAEDQRVFMNGYYHNEKDFDIEVELENVSLAKVIPKSALGDDFKIDGISNGKISLIREGEKLKPVADFRIENILLNQYTIGNFVLDASYDIEEQIFNLQGSLDRNNINALYLTGLVDNKGETPQLDVVASMDDLRVDVLGVFLEDVMDEWSGTLSGDLSIKGNPIDPTLNGFITGEDIGFRVVYLGTKYVMKGENDLILTKSEGTDGYLTIPDIEFTETNSNTKGNVDGNLIFSTLSNWFLGLTFETDRLLVMNNSVADNELFFGKVYGSGTFDLFGPATDLDISGYDVNVLKGSNISINTGATSTIENNGFIQFYAYDENGNIIENENEELEVSGFSINLDLNVDEGTTVNLVIDEQNSDQIIAQGNAQDFKIQMNKAGNLNIEGEYTLTSGIYNYKEALIIDKDFEIEKGGYIRFDGDPYNATMDIRAVYDRYVNNVDEYLGLKDTQAQLIDLVIAITGNLERTNIDFLIEAPDAGSQVKSALENKLSGNVDERTLQAGYILGLGKFGTEGQVNAATASTVATASALELVGKQVGNVLSNFIPGFEINPVYLQGDENNYQNSQIQTQYNLALNERLKINGSVGAPLGTETNKEVTMELEVDYDVSKEANGELILRGFSRPTTLGIENFNVNSTFAQSYGAGVVYKRSFNSFKELFKKKDKLNKAQHKVDSIVNDTLTMEEKSFIQFSD